MGQVPLDPPNVKGWPGGRAWINTSTLFVRYNTCIWLAGGEMSVRGGGRVFGGNYGGRNRSMAVKFSPRPRGAAEEVVDEWVERLIQRPIADEKKQVLLDAVGSTPSEASIKKMVQLIVSMPEYQLC
jgi:hypothetical protein